MADLESTVVFGVAVVAMLAGLAMTIIPQLPGVLIIWLVALVYALQDGFSAPGPVLFGLITLFGLVGATTDLWMKLLGAKAGGASFWGLVAGAVFGLVGLIVFFPLGGIIGSVLGVMLVEGLRTGDMRAILQTGGGTLAGYLLSVVVELTLGILTIALFVVSVLYPLDF